MYDARTSERELLRNGVVERLENTEGLKFVRDSHDATHLVRVTLGAPFQADDAVVTVPLDVALKATGDAAEFSASAFVPQGASLPTTWLAAFDDAWPILQVMRKLDVAKDKDLLHALGDSDVRLRAFAIQRLGERKAKAAVKPLCDLLTRESDAEVVFKTMGALVAIGDQRAVEPLIALAHQKDPAFVLQVVFAVGAIGGRTARAYLVTLASGHPNEEVQRGAKDALEELSHRGKGKQP